MYDIVKDPGVKQLRLVKKNPANVEGPWATIGLLEVTLERALEMRDAMNASRAKRSVPPMEDQD